MATKKTEVTEVKEVTAEVTAEVTPPVAETPKMPEKVELYIPRGNANDDPNFFIGINGKSYLLPRGKTSMVPPEVKAEYERSEKADERLNDTVDRLIKEAQTIHHA